MLIILRQKGLDIVYRKVSDSFQVGHHIRLIAVGVFHRGHQLLHRVLGKFPVQFLDPLVMFTLQQRQVTDNRL